MLDKVKIRSHHWKLSRSVIFWVFKYFDQSLQHIYIEQSLFSSLYQAIFFFLLCLVIEGKYIDLSSKDQSFRCYICGESGSPIRRDIPIFSASIYYSVLSSLHVNLERNRELLSLKDSEKSRDEGMGLHSGVYFLKIRAAQNECPHCLRVFSRFYSNRSLT